jgi:hypothetical protein
MSSVAKAVRPADNPEKVKSLAAAGAKNLALCKAPRLERVTFQTSREMDFFSPKELVTQTGHGVHDWPLVIPKELLDNSLDASEDADIPPVIDVTADASGIAVTDNGPGLPEATLRGAMDFRVRASNREAYVSPCRGSQGNALKTLLPMPHVLDPVGGRFILASLGTRHVIACRADPISQRPVIHDDVTDTPTSGTSVRLEWSPRADGAGNALWPFGADPDRFLRAEDFAKRFRDLVAGFAVFNPHLTIRLDWFGKKTAWEATDPRWQKWKPNRPTSPHWYELAHLERLIAAYITHDRDAGTDRLVSEFLAEFDGLTGSAKRKKVLHETGLKRVRLSELVAGDSLDGERVRKLLAAMKWHTRPVASRLLGTLGEDHLRARLEGMGVVPQSFRYSRETSDAKSKKSARSMGEKAGFAELPWVLESAFGWRGEAVDGRRIYAGANWSAALANPFRSFGETGEGLETALANRRATASEPVVFVLHLAHPRVEYRDRGKSAIIIG